MNAHATRLMDMPVLPVIAQLAPPSANASIVTRDDCLLVASLKNGDARAFDMLVKQNHGALIHMAMKYVSDRDVAEEVVQNTWIAVIDGIHKFESRSSLKTWIMSILIHKAKDRGVRESRHVNFSTLEPYDEERDEGVDPAQFLTSGDIARHWALPPQPWDEQTPERMLVSRQALAALNKAIDEMPAGLREVLVMRDIQEIESDEICRQLNLTKSYLYVRLHRARKRVRRALEATPT